ncbi:MAG: gliding motility-associated C-terminal domain-containing protein [Bacteroidetes bacterium]|nr:gliding motility-associated C-terminal domain-containing protein [Bacteroidota bacterium]
MFKVIKKFVLIFLLLIISSSAFATHYMGGEITWTCVGTQYKFRMKTYRECGGIPMNPSENLSVANYTGALSIPMVRISQLDISPVCNSDVNFPHITCASTPFGLSNTGAIEEHIYESGLITLTGVPPPAGWIFSWSSSARNPSTNLVGQPGWTLRAIMYSYNWQNANPCFDNSPTFAEKPSAVLPVGNPFTYNHNAFDQDLDSLAYSWAAPLDEYNAPCPYNAPYSITNPMPGLVNATPFINGMNPYTGEIKFNSITPGAFVTVIKVTAYRCNIKIAEIFREMQIVLTPNTNSNHAPVVTGPFANPVTGNYTVYSDTVRAGELVCFTLYATDFENLQNGAPQTINILASGPQFGAGFTNPAAGCLNPPCATLNPAPPFGATFGLSPEFCWQTTCDHLATNNGCGSTSNTYNFVVKLSDDNCPVPGVSFNTITIVVLATPVLLAPEARCAAVAPNGDVTISWKPPVDTVNSFDSYHIYASANAAGPYVKIDSLFNINTTSYTQTNFASVPGGNGNNHSIYYYIKTRSGCLGQYYSNPSDTIRTMYLNVTNSGTGNANLTWNPVHNPNLPTSLGKYYIYREYPLGTWTLIDSTLNTNYSSNVIFACDTFKYRVEIKDALPCTSVSNIDWAPFTDTLAAPELRCLAVDAAGNVTVNFEKPLDPLNIFNAYMVYSSPSAAGPFVLKDSIFNINQTTWVHTGANANANSVYYYILTRTSCVGAVASSEPSDTIHTIFLNATNSGTGLANLVWTPIHNPLLPTSFTWYRIYREYPAGVWTLIDSTNALNYQDTITVCNAFINYRIEIADSLPCNSVSNIDGDLFQDITPPIIPVLDSVSVNLAGFSNLGWNASTSLDTRAYIIYQNIGGIWSPIDTVWGINNTSYINLLSNPSNGYESYCIAAFDSCMNTSPIGVNQNTIYLTSLLDICAGKTKLIWTPYINMTTTISGYRIYASENGGPFVLVGTNPSTNQSFDHVGLNSFSNYCYYVQAFDNIGQNTSTSNQSCIFADSPEQPKFIYLRYATVKDNDYVQIRCFVDTSAYVKSVKIMRATYAAGTYTQIGTAYSNNSPDVFFADHSADFNQKSYYYKAIIVDSCGNEVISSNVGRTVYLEVEAKQDMTNVLTWNDYEDWLGSVSSYLIYRQIDDLPGITPIANVPFGLNTYIDDVSNFTEMQGRFMYYVDALEGNGNIYMFKDTSTSNQVLALQAPKLFVPNAFVPKGYNTIFLPIGVFVDATDYQFSIYNRWGQEIFSTSDLKQGWDGMYKGTYAPEGVYVYTIRYKNSQNKYIEKRGIVTLVM